MVTNKQKEDLTIKCVELISKTLVQLGQTKTAEDISILATTLSYDLLNEIRFRGMTFLDVEISFYRGLRETELFALNVKTFYTWILNHKQKIDTEKINERLKLNHKPNPELSYRSRKGTGLKKINQIKQIK